MDKLTLLLLAAAVLVLAVAFVVLLTRWHAGDAPSIRKQPPRQAAVPRGCHPQSQSLNEGAHPLLDTEYTRFGHPADRGYSRAGPRARRGALCPHGAQCYNLRNPSFFSP